MRRVASVLAVVVLSCTSGPPVVPSGPAPPPAGKSAAPVVRCNDAAPAIKVSAAHTTADPAQVPGRVLFWQAGKLSTLENGRVIDLAPPFPARDRSSRLAPDGRIVALLAGPTKGESYLWEHSIDQAGRLVRVPFTAEDEDADVLWSPDGRKAAWLRFGGDEVVTIGLDGVSHRASFPGEAVYTVVWRNSEQLSVVSAPATNDAWPIREATLWSWLPPAAPVRSGGPLTLAVPPVWTPDGSHLATLEVTASGKEVALHGATSRRLLSQTDVQVGPAGCVRQVEFTGLSWAPDSRTLAVLARTSTYSVAFIGLEPGARASLFALPVQGGSCYIPGRIDWHDAIAVVPLYGPDCGFSADDRRENALALVDPKSGALIRYVAMSRKGFLGAAGGWAATSGPLDDGSTEFIELDTDRRITVQLKRVADYCCIP